MCEDYGSVLYNSLLCRVADIFWFVGVKKNFWKCLQENMSPCSKPHKSESLCTALHSYLQTVFLAWNKIIPTLYKHKNIKSQLFKEDNSSSFGFQLSCAHIYTDVHRDVQVKQQPTLLQAGASEWVMMVGRNFQAKPTRVGEVGVEQDLPA